MKKLTIEISEKGEKASFNVKTENLHTYELIGILETILVLQKQKLIIDNKQL